MRLEEFNRLRRGDLIRVGYTFRVVHLGPADYEHTRVARKTECLSWVTLGKVVRNARWDKYGAGTTYSYSDIGRRCTFIKHAPSMLSKDIGRCMSLGFDARNDQARAIRNVKRLQRLGLFKLKSDCRMSQ